MQSSFLSNSNCVCCLEKSERVRGSLRKCWSCTYVHNGKGCSDICEDNVDRGRKVSPVNTFPALKSVWGQSLVRKVSSLPGGNSGLWQMGVTGHTEEDILNWRHVFLKICNVLPIKGCCLDSGGICVEAT